MSAVPEALARAEAALLAAGAPFELTTVEYLGERVTTYLHRPPHLRALVERAAQHGARPYAVFASRTDERTVRFDELAGRVGALADALARDHGVVAGDRVALLGENRLEWLLGFFATTSLGAVAVGFNGWWTGDEIRHAIADCRPKVLLADDKRLARLADEPAGVPVRRMESPDFEPALPLPLPTVAIAPEDPAIILYSSGTTGRPKGAVHTHFNLASMVMTSFFHGARMTAALGLPAGAPSVALVTSPLFHVSGLHAAAITSLAGGATTVWPMGRFDAHLALSLIERHRVTGWGYTATILKRLLECPDLARFDTSSMRLVGGGGSPIPAALQERARAALPSAKSSLGVGYGLTEACAFTCLVAGDELTQHPESSGRPLPGIEVEIRGADGAALPEGVVGDVFVRGPLVMREYFDNPAATSEVLFPGRWLRTGDIGAMIEGRIHLASRRFDLILRGGENIYPAEVERCLEEHPDVAEAAVYGVPDEEFGQAVHAVVVPRPGRSVDEASLLAACRAKLAYFKVPTSTTIRTSPLPRNATGKIHKPSLIAGEPAPFVEE